MTFINSDVHHRYVTRAPCSVKTRSSSHRLGNGKMINFRRRNKQWIVLVDDEESIRYAVGDFLYDRGYQVTACADANSMLELIFERNRNNNNDRDGGNDSKENSPRLPDSLSISHDELPRACLQPSINSVFP